MHRELGYVSILEYFRLISSFCILIKLLNMPITQSAKKALRQSLRRKARNLRRADTYKINIKQLKKLAADNQTKEAQNLLPKVYKAIDKAAKTGVIKKNKAARLKSAAAKLLAKK